jgi:hypothetical protein
MDPNVYQLREAGGCGTCWDGNVTVLPIYVAESALTSNHPYIRSTKMACPVSLSILFEYSDENGFKERE